MTEIVFLLAGVLLGLGVGAASCRSATSAAWRAANAARQASSACERSSAASFSALESAAQTVIRESKGTAASMLQAIETLEQAHTTSVKQLQRHHRMAVARIAEDAKRGH